MKKKGKCVEKKEAADLVSLEGNLGVYSDR
jgi:hypothetical protein